MTGLCHFELLESGSKLHCQQGFQYTNSISSTKRIPHRYVLVTLFISGIVQTILESRFYLIFIGICVLEPLEKNKRWSWQTNMDISVTIYIEYHLSVSLCGAKHCPKNSVGQDFIK